MLVEVKVEGDEGGLTFSALSFRMVSMKPSDICGLMTMDIVEV